MRVRKVLNFYLDEPAHADLLDFLEAIEGDARRQQALLQMALVGFRVMEKHESGQEAYLRSRNPDLSRLTGNHKRAMIEGGVSVERRPAVKRKPRTYDVNDSGQVHDQAQAGVASVIDVSQDKAKNQQTHAHEPLVEPGYTPPLEEEFQDPLALLQQLTQ